ncbi:hypothetical protein RHO15_05315 [Utexia brackfieldae]|uniref:hypothetical protein n=1 Tax=Utexia brackfieldae TaxID=3074108 RepID=UPI00370D10AF
MGDRTGYDYRYAIDHSKITRTLHWQPSYTFEQGFMQTMIWYIAHPLWWQTILDKSYLNGAGSSCTKSR